jgi:hypothetical protein
VDTAAQYQMPVPSIPGVNEYLPSQILGAALPERARRSASSSLQDAALCRNQRIDLNYVNCKVHRKVRPHPGDEYPGDQITLRKIGAIYFWPDRHQLLSFDRQGWGTPLARNLS